MYTHPLETVTSYQDLLEMTAEESVETLEDYEDAEYEEMAGDLRFAPAVPSVYREL